MAVESDIAIGEAQRRIEETPKEPIEIPRESGSFGLDQAVVDGEYSNYLCMSYTPITSSSIVLPVQDIKHVRAFRYTESLAGNTAKVVVETSDGKTSKYFLKVRSDIHMAVFSVITMLLQVIGGNTGGMKCEGEYESLAAIHAISPGFVPKPFAWGKFHNKEPEAYFLLEEFRDFRNQVGPLDLLFHLVPSFNFS